MRNLRKVALVAAMIGTLGMAGAGVASAGESGSDGDGRNCVNYIDNSSFGLINIPNLNLNLPLLGSDSHNQSGTQQLCNNGDEAINANVANNEG